MTKLRVLQALKNGDMMADLHEMPTKIAVFRRVGNIVLFIEQSAVTKVSLLHIDGVETLMKFGEYLTLSQTVMPYEKYQILIKDTEEIANDVNKSDIAPNTIITDEIIDKLIKDLEKQPVKLAEFPVGQLM